MTEEIHEYRVRPVTRYIVTSFYQTPDGRAGGNGHGEFDNADTAYQVAYALCKQEHERLGFPAFDDRIQYPSHPNMMQSSLEQSVSDTVIDGLGSAIGGTP